MLRHQEEVPVIVLKEFEIKAYIKGHHLYKNIWILEISKSLSVQIEPNNSVHKYAACIQKSEKVRDT